jgi:hypothetical protein
LKVDFSYFNPPLRPEEREVAAVEDGFSGQVNW